jgi:membrane associated rhomboid family serine protease
MGVNLGCLLLCGKELIPILGSLRFLGLFLGAGTASSVAQVAWPHVAPEHLAYSQYELGLGASGAVNAVVAYNILSFPGRIIMVLMVAPMPAIIPGLVFLGRDCVGFASGDAADLNVAHMSGTAFGFAVWLLTARLRRGIPSMGFRF